MGPDTICLEDIPFVCRTCLKRSDLAPIFSTFAEGIEVSQLIIESVVLPVNLTDALPKNICLKCVNNLYLFYVFKKQCHNVDSLLRLLLKTQINFTKPDMGLEEEVKSDIIENDDNIEIKEEIIDENLKVHDHNYAYVDVDDYPKIESDNDDDQKEIFPELRQTSNEAYQKCPDHEPIDSRVENVEEIKERKHKPPPKRSAKMCEICGKIYRKDFKRHYVTHLGLRAYKCNVCSKGFFGKNCLRRHMTCHSSERPFVCEKCGISFSRVDYLKRHRYFHETNKELTHFCDKCGKGYSNPYYLSTHKYSKHNKVQGLEENVAKTRMRSKKAKQTSVLDVPLYVCSLCGLNYKKLVNFSKHLETHTAAAINSEIKVPKIDGNKESICPICHVSCKNRPSLYSHIQIHREKRFSCNRCDKKFRTLRELKLHTETYKKIYQCEKCPKRFGKSHTLKQHNLIHTGELPHECQTCGRRFRQRVSLMFHVKTHTGEPHSCNICGEDFINYEQLKKHKREHRKEEN